MPLIELRGGCKTYQLGGVIQVQALKDISLSIEAGEFIAIMGASGSGKSTLLAVLGLLDRAECGQYLLLGKEVGALPERELARLRNRFFGFIFQSFNLLSRIDIVSNTLLPFIYGGGATAEDKKYTQNILQKIGLGDRLKHKPKELSGGQQQRVALARALAGRPLVILADEPTGNLDSKSAREIIGLFKEINAQGNTVIMVTHEQSLAEEASRIVTLSDGKIVSDEKKRQIAPGQPIAKGREVAEKRQPLSLSRLRDYFTEAALSLLNNKLRSLLSILGVVIGVGAVIAMLAVGTGAKKQVEKSFSALGTNVLMVRTAGRQQGIALGADSVTRFNLADYEALKQIDGVKAVVPYVSGRAQIVYTNKNWNTTVYGSSADYQSVRDAFPDKGRFFTAREMQTRAKVAVLGVTVAAELFQGEEPLGKWIKINRINFQVIGVLPEKGISGFRNADDQIVVPLPTAMYRLLGTDYISNFDIKVDSADQLDPVSEEIVPLLVKLHRLPPSQEDIFEVRNMADIQKAATEAVATFSFLLGAIAAVSLLVGGIGIMNIMLVSVIERTHEIGLRKALGADDLDIMTQFLVESVLICLTGGIAGIVLGWLTSWTIGNFAGWNVLVTWYSIVMAFTFSAGVGLLFGLWPARRAARLLPIEALRYE